MSFYIFHRQRVCIVDCVDLICSLYSWWEGCGSSDPVTVEREGSTAAWLVGTLAAPSVHGHGLPLPQELWPYQSLFSSLL